MKLHLLGTLYIFILNLLKSLILFVVPLTFVHASTIFQFEGELTRVDSPLLETFSIGDTFSGAYTFDPNTSTTSAPPVSVFIDAISEMSYSSDTFNVSATNGNIIYDIEDEPLYEANSLGTFSGTSIEGYTLQRLTVGWEPESLFFPQETPPVDPFFNPFDDNGFLVIDFDKASEYYSVTGSLSSVSVIHTPIPAAVWLFGSSLMGLIAVTRKLNRPNIQTIKK